MKALVEENKDLRKRLQLALELCNDLEEEQASFPQGTTDDVLDATAYMIPMEVSAPRKKKRRSNNPVKRGSGLRGT